MYSVNMNRGMEKYSNRIMCTQMEEFVIVNNQKVRNKVCFPFSFCC